MPVQEGGERKRDNQKRAAALPISDEPRLIRAVGQLDERKEVGGGKWMPFSLQWRGLFPSLRVYDGKRGNQ